MLTLDRIRRCRAGTSAIEFAIVAPLFILILLSLCAFGIYLGTAHAVQQIAADTARVAVAGLNASERSALAEAHITEIVFDYPFIEPENLMIEVGDDVAPGQFTVRLAYDAGHLPIWNLMTFAMPDQEIERYATIRIGGL
jgi:Flp pilus assembly protein TadG